MQAVLLYDVHWALPLAVVKGAVCTRKACGVTRDDETSDDSPCEHHPGGPIFHEG